MLNLRRLAEEAHSVVDEAGKILADHAEKPREIRHKGRIDLVTATDVAIENFLKKNLKDLLPEASFLAEESAVATVPGEYTWIIDPVDGTTNFAHGVPVVAISVGLWHADAVALGIVSAPLMNECFTATLGGGAYLNGKQIHVSSVDTLTEALVATGFPYAIEEELPDILRRLGGVLASCQGVRRMGAAALDLAYVAAGRFDAFYEANLKPWDKAAGSLLVQEAGGWTGRMDGSGFSLLAPDILASNGRVHTLLQTLL